MFRLSTFRSYEQNNKEIADYSEKEKKQFLEVLDYFELSKDKWKSYYKIKYPIP